MVHPLLLKHFSLRFPGTPKCRPCAYQQHYRTCGRGYCQKAVLAMHRKRGHKRIEELQVLDHSHRQISCNWRVGGRKAFGACSLVMCLRFAGSSAAALRHFSSDRGVVIREFGW